MYNFYWNNDILYIYIHIIIAIYYNTRNVITIAKRYTTILYSIYRTIISYNFCSFFTIATSRVVIYFYDVIMYNDIDFCG